MEITNKLIKHPKSHYSFDFFYTTSMLYNFQEITSFGGLGSPLLLPRGLFGPIGGAFLPPDPYPSPVSAPERLTDSVSNRTEMHEI